MCISLIIALIGVLVLSISLDSAIRPIIIEHSAARAQIAVNNIANEVVYTVLNEERPEYGDIVTVVRGEDNAVASVEINTLYVSLIKSRIIGLIQEKVSANDSVSVGIPLGTLTGSDYLIGRGPAINIKMNISTAVFCDIESSLVSAGINQTLHQISLSIRANIYLMMPMFRSSTEFSTDFLIAETVIVGDVPDAYTNVIENPDSDTAGMLFDYAAG